jgi:hypothetical protein
MMQTARVLTASVAVALAVSAVGLTQETSQPLRPGDPQAGALPAAVTAEGVLQSLPRPPAWPASLFVPAPQTAAGVNLLDRPYFLPDPLLDPPQFPPPGWFAGLELDVLKPHVTSELTGTVQNAAQVAVGTATTVALPGAPLEWIASPRVVLGYRLPAGFGEVSLAYRGLGTRGSEDVVGADGPESLHSRLDFNIIDLDYGSREFSLWPNWDMKWTVGVRTLFLFFDSRADQPSTQAATGSGIVQSGESNHVTGVGPHTGLALSRSVGDTGLALVLRSDFASVFGHIHERFFSVSTTPGPNGQPLAGETGINYDGNVAILNAQVGVSWQPPAYPCARVFLGYQYEYWWRLSGNGNPDADQGSRANLWDQGIVFQGAIHF